MMRKAEIVFFGTAGASNRLNNQSDCDEKTASWGTKTFSHENQRGDQGESSKNFLFPIANPEQESCSRLFQEHHNQKSAHIPS
jgi:hypothetical protein